VFLFVLVCLNINTLGIVRYTYFAGAQFAVVYAQLPYNNFMKQPIVCIKCAAVLKIMVAVTNLLDHIRNCKLYVLITKNTQLHNQLSYYNTVVEVYYVLSYPSPKRYYRKGGNEFQVS